MSLPPHLREAYRQEYKRGAQQTFVDHMDRLAKKLEPKNWAAQVEATFAEIRASAAAQRAIVEPSPAVGPRRIIAFQREGEQTRIILGDLLRETKEQTDIMREPETELEIP